MSQAPAMPVWTDALIGDTTHLSAEEFGAYCLLLFATWRNNGRPLANDDTSLARVTRTGLNRWVNRLKPRLIGFFDISDGYLHQKRLESEWKKTIERIKRQSAKGKRSAELRALKSNERPSAAVDDRFQPNGNYPDPLSKKDSEAIASGVAEAPPDPLKVFWKQAVEMLVDAGMKETQARSLIGKWKRDFGMSAVMVAFDAAERDPPIDLVGFLVGCMRNFRGSNGHAKRLSPAEKLFLGFAQAAQGDFGADSSFAKPLLDS